MLAGPIFWPMEDSPQVLRFYRDWIADVPDELMTIVVHRKAPPLPAIPAELHGRPVVDGHGAATPARSRRANGCCGR